MYPSVSNSRKKTNLSNYGVSRVAMDWSRFVCTLTSLEKSLLYRGVNPAV